jgi:CheY-like chemotaxis protein
MNFNGHKKKRIVVVDKSPADADSLVKALHRDGLEVLFFHDTQRAYESCINMPPALLVAELEMPMESGLQLIRRLKTNYVTRYIPIIVTAKENVVEERLKNLQIGIDDYVAKPYYPEEIACRIETILQEIEAIAETRSGHNHSFSGNLGEMNLVDLIQTLELGNRSGIVYLIRNHEEGRVYVEEGKVIDAMIDGLTPQQALINMLTWLEGTFMVSLQSVDRMRMISQANREILQQGTKLIQQWREMANKLPPLNTVVSAVNNADRAYITKPEKNLLLLFSEPKTILQGIETSKLNDLRALEIIKTLFDKGLLIKETSAQKFNNPLAKNISERIEHERARTQSNYSRIAAFFKRKNNHKSTFASGSPIGNEPQSAGSQSNGKGASMAAKSPHKIMLTKGELLLIRQNLASH